MPKLCKYCCEILEGSVVNGLHEDCNLRLMEELEDAFPFFDMEVDDECPHICDDYYDTDGIDYYPQEYEYLYDC